MSGVRSGVEVGSTGRQCDGSRLTRPKTVDSGGRCADPALIGDQREDAASRCASVFQSAAEVCTLGLPACPETDVEAGLKLKAAAAEVTVKRHADGYLQSRAGDLDVALIGSRG